MKFVPVVFGSKQTAQPFGMLLLPDQIFQPDSEMLSANVVLNYVQWMYVCTYIVYTYVCVYFLSYYT